MQDLGINIYKNELQLEKKKKSDTKPIGPIGVILRGGPIAMSASQGGKLSHCI